MEASSQSQPPDTFIPATPPDGVSRLPVPASIPTLGSSVSALARLEARRPLPHRPRSCRPHPIQKLASLFLVGLGLVLATFYLSSLGIPRIRLGPNSRHLRLSPRLFLLGLLGSSAPHHRAPWCRLRLQIFAPSPLLSGSFRPGSPRANGPSSKPSFPTLCFGFHNASPSKEVMGCSYVSTLPQMDDI